MRRHILALALALAGATAGCDLAPRYVRPASAIPPAWPTGDSYAAGTPAGPSVPAGVAWRDLVSDPKLATLIARALADNRSLRATVANVAAARAQYRIAHSVELPTLSAQAEADVAHGDHVSTHSYSAEAGISSFEIDLFGRLRNLSRAAFETYLGTAEGAREARIILVSEVATAYASWAADRDLLTVITAALGSARNTVKLTESLRAAGLASQVDLASAEAILAGAQSDLQSGTTQVAQDRNALELLVGAPVADALQPTTLDVVDAGVGHVPAGLTSDILLQRPDVLQAEHDLKSHYADIGAARAAFFPTLTLTSAAGLLTTALSSFLTGGASAWSVVPALGMPILGGATRAQLAQSKAERDAALATYQGTAQTAYEEVANALARSGTIRQQGAAQRRLVAASEASYRLAMQLYRVGAGRFLDALVAERTLYSARGSALATQLNDVTNRIALYESLGGEISPPHQEITDLRPGTAGRR
jgi:multidrug efflux system outer membrane protein